MQMAGKADFIAQYAKDGDLYGMIIAMIQKIPCAPLVLVVLLLTMIAFYATSFDFDCADGFLLQLPPSGRGTAAIESDSAYVCLLLILLSDCTGLFRKLYEQSAVGQYRGSVSDRNGNSSDCGGISKGCRSISERNKEEMIFYAA